MRIGIDTLFLDGSQPSSTAYFVAGFVEALVRQTHRHRIRLRRGQDFSMRRVATAFTAAIEEAVA
jgi:hypothetical protein